MDTSLSLFSILLPLFGFLLVFFLGKKLGKTLTGILATSTVAISFIVSILLFNQISSTSEPIVIDLYRWFSFETIHIDLAFYIDQLTVVWMLFITGIGSLIHLYSVGYMSHDEHFSKFLSYLNLFVFFMLVLVAGKNLLVMFIGWEGVGLCSYLLIGFWHQNQAFNDAAKKAFIVNRIGDLGFLIGVFILISLFGTIDFVELKQVAIGGVSASALPVLAGATLALFIAATGKSAQLPLYVWLPDAMAGPTPVSALIHAATMVTAGIFMITRLNFIYDLTPEIQNIIAIVGALTSLLAASIALVQNDIKKVLAYSTVSQLGLMFLALGLGAYEVAIFHVITHAFFKACLFLGSGSVIHAVSNEQDMRKMGGLKSVMKITYVTFLISSLAISGIPPFSGFFSKDEILLTAFHHNIALYVIASLASVFTAFYMFRLLFLTFFNSFRGTEKQKQHLHESPKSMTLPLVVLALLALAGGLISFPGNSWLNEFVAPVIVNNAHSKPHQLGTTEYALMAVAVTGALIAIFIAYSKYLKKGIVPAEDSNLSGIGKILYNKFYIDEVYTFLIVKPLLLLALFFKKVVEVVLGTLVVSLAFATGELSMLGKKLQNGNIGVYLFAFVLGVGAIIYFLF